MSIRQHAESSQRLLPEKTKGQLKSDLRKQESEDLWVQFGECLEFARNELRWTIDRLARELPPPKGKSIRDEAQVRRWISGAEHLQFDVVFAVPELKAPFVVGLARLAQNDFEEETILRRRRSPLPMQR